jgi:hypothetical protein
MIVYYLIILKKRSNKMAKLATKIVVAAAAAFALTACAQKINSGVCEIDTSDPENITATITDKFTGADIATGSYLQGKRDGTLKTYNVKFGKYEWNQLFEGGYHRNRDYLEVDTAEKTCTLGNDNHVKWFEYPLAPE